MPLLNFLTSRAVVAQTADGDSQTASAAASRQQPRKDDAYGWWKQQLKPAQSIADAVAAHQPTRTLPPRTGSAAPAGRDSRGEATALQINAMPGLPDIRPLDANWVSDTGKKTLVMKSPAMADSLSWAMACVQQKVGVVVELGTHEETSGHQHCMTTSTPRPYGGYTSEFKAKYKEAFKPDLRAVAIGAGPSTECDMKVAIRPEGTHQGETQSHSLRLVQIPMSPNQDVSARDLLDTCRLLRKFDPQQEQVAVFMSPDGKHRGVALAAADRLYTDILEGKVSEASLQDDVKTICIDLRQHRQAAGLNTAGELASLLAFGKMALAEDAAAIRKPRPRADIPAQRWAMLIPPDDPTVKG